MVKGMSEAIKNSPYLTGAWKQGLKEGKRVGAVEELERLLKRAKKIPEDLWAVTIIEKRLFQLNGTKEKGFGE